MSHNRRSRGSWVLGPRALAVLSCALALLAAQPVMAAERTSSRGTEVRVERVAHAPAAEISATLTGEGSRRSRGTPPQRFLRSWESARRLHVLATVEILHRLLIAEFRPGFGSGVERQLSGAVLFSPIEPVAFAIVPTGITLPVQVIPLPSHSHERAFAIAHCLLAPPAA